MNYNTTSFSTNHPNHDWLIDWFSWKRSKKWFFCLTNRICAIILCDHLKLCLNKSPKEIKWLIRYLDCRLLDWLIDWFVLSAAHTWIWTVAHTLSRLATCIVPLWNWNNSGLKAFYFWFVYLFFLSFVFVFLSFFNKIFQISIPLLLAVGSPDWRNFLLQNWLWCSFLTILGQ